MSQLARSFVRRHPALTLIGFNLFLFAIVFVVAEIALRFVVSYQPAYYVSVKGTDHVLEYPYGIIKINSRGFPDDEFDMSKGRNIGYYGDSVTYGVGAGHGYRISDLLEREYPEMSHMNLGGVGGSISDDEAEDCRRLARDLDLDLMIYFANLNDILPDEMASEDVTTVVRTVKTELLRYADWLRGRSYVYTWLRTAVRNVLAARGTGFHGYSTFEFYPSEHSAVIAQTAGRINRLHESLREEGTELVVVYLPYEMQISREAALTYADSGIRWEEAFINGETQRMLDEYLDDSVRRYDAMEAFVDPEDPEASREANGLGVYFVYDRGDKLDWNHPTREGHRKIADFIIQENVLAREQPERH